jgi:HD-like signal output (HDOD) protein
LNPNEILWNEMSQIDPDLIKYLVPIRELNPAERMHLSRLVKVRAINLGDKIHYKDCADFFIYLLEGKLDLCDEHIEPQLIHGDDLHAQYSLFNNTSANSYIVASSSCKLLLVEREQFNVLMDDDIVMESDQINTDISYIETNIYNEIFQAIESEKLKLPSLPEVALKVKSAIAKDDMGVDDIARIAESDPAIVVRLIQVANSPMTRGVEPVNSIHDAIVRLGLSMTQNLVVSFSMKQLFESDQQILKVRMKQMYKHSVEISAISFALSKKLKRFDADQLLLAGLIHDIGVIPILTYIDETGLEIHSEKEVDSVIAKLRSAVGSLVVKSWGFSEDMVSVVEQAENWFKNGSDKIDMSDIVIVAQIYSLLQHKKLDALPDIKKVPVFKRMFKEEPDSEFVMNVLNDAQEMIDEVTQVLSI